MRESTWIGDAGRIRSGRRVGISLGNVLVFSVTGGRHAAAGAREEIRERLGPKLDPAVVELAELLLSELVNNCVLHGKATHPDAWIDITASLFPHTLWIEVCDGGPAFEHTPCLPATHADSGRGLYLVEQLSSAWGISETGSVSVWFELERDAAAVARRRSYA